MCDPTPRRATNLLDIHGYRFQTFKRVRQLAALEARRRPHARVEDHDADLAATRRPPPPGSHGPPTLVSRVERLVLRSGDERLLQEWSRSSSIAAGLAQRAPDRAVGRCGGEQQRDQPPGRGEPADRAGVAGPLRHRRSAGAAGPAPVGAAGGARRSHDHRGDPEPTTGRALGVTHWSARLSQTTSTSASRRWLARGASGA